MLGDVLSLMYRTMLFLVDVRHVDASLFYLVILYLSSVPENVTRSLFLRVFAVKICRIGWQTCVITVIINNVISVFHWSCVVIML